MMRVTENTFTKNYLLNINSTRSRMSKLQDQLSTGKKIMNPSDDPEAASRILRMQNSIARNGQYQANVTDAMGMVSATSNAIDKFSDILVQTKEVLTKARSGIGNMDMSVLAEQVDQLIGDLVQAGNTAFNGKYLFGGTRTTSPPFIFAADRSAVTINPNGITGKIEVLINEGTTQVVNIDGQQAFQGAAVFQTLIQIRDGLKLGTPPTDAQVDTVNSELDYVASQGGKAGFIQKALDMADAFLSDSENALTAMLSIDMDTDFAQATLELKKEEMMLDAALSTGAHLIPKTLMDFLQ